MINIREITILYSKQKKRDLWETPGVKLYYKTRK